MNIMQPELFLLYFCHRWTEHTSLTDALTTFFNSLVNNDSVQSWEFEESDVDSYEDRDTEI